MPGTVQERRVDHSHPCQHRFDEGTIDVFKSALSGSKAVLHSNSSNLYGVLDNDDVFQYLGGTAMAIRQIDGATPDAFIVNLTNPAGGRHETVERYLSREMRSRYLNPKWIEEMLDEGYAGSRFVAQTVDNLWGWEVTTPDAVDDSKWREMYETYILDKHGLDIEARFRDNDNLRALQSIADRMLTVIAKGYWDEDRDIRERLAETNRRLIEEADKACDALDCSSQEVLNLDRRPGAGAEGIQPPSLPPAPGGAAPSCCRERSGTGGGSGGRRADPSCFDRRRARDRDGNMGSASAGRCAAGARASDPFAAVVPSRRSGRCLRNCAARYWQKDCTGRWGGG